MIPHTSASPGWYAPVELQTVPVVKVVIRRGPNVNDEIVYKERRKVPKERFLHLFTFVRAVTCAIRLCGPFTYGSLYSLFSLKQISSLTIDVG